MDPICTHTYVHVRYFGTRGSELQHRTCTHCWAVSRREMPSWEQSQLGACPLDPHRTSMFMDARSTKASAGSRPAPTSGHTTMKTSEPSILEDVHVTCTALDIFEDVIGSLACVAASCTFSFSVSKALRYALAFLHAPLRKVSHHEHNCAASASMLQLFFCICIHSQVLVCTRMAYAQE